MGRLVALSFNPAGGEGRARRRLRRGIVFWGRGGGVRRDGGAVKGGVRLRRGEWEACVPVLGWRGECV